MLLESNAQRFKVKGITENLNCLFTLLKKLIRHLFHKFIDKFSVFFEGVEEAFTDEIVINLVPRT